MGNRRRSSGAQNMGMYGPASGRRSASLTPCPSQRLSAEYNSGGSNSSTPRGSLSNINNIRGRSSSINTSNLNGRFHQASVSLKTAALLNNSRLNNGTPASPQLGKRVSGSGLSSRESSSNRLNHNDSKDETHKNNAIPQLTRNQSSVGTTNGNAKKSSLGGSMSRDVGLCDSSSEVSDEGYKSSQGGVIPSMKMVKEDPSSAIPKDSSSNSSADVAFSSSSHEGNASERPLSSLTAASECSSTISSEDEGEADSKGLRDSEVISPPPPPPENVFDGELISPEEQLPPPPSSPTDSSISGDGDTWKTPTNKDTDTSPPGSKVVADDGPRSSKSSKLGNLLSNMKIPTFKFKRNGETFSLSDESPPTASPEKKANDECSRELFVDTHESRLTGKMNRSRSASGDQINVSGSQGSHFNRGVPGRHSYRAPSATSRYMQAAEAYAAKSREARNKSANNDPRSFWGPNGRGREGSTGSGFYPQRSHSRNSNLGSRPASRTASASPGVTRRRRTSGTGTISRDNSFTALKSESVQPLPTSTHSTPCKKAQPKVSTSSSVSKHSTSSKSNAALADLEVEDDLILKRMEEILLTYKSKVEDHLAAEGRELPKEIFEDFTSQWVQNSTSRGNLSTSATPVMKSKSNGNLSVSVRTTPVLRQDKRGSSERTRIPMPVYYNSPSERI